MYKIIDSDITKFAMYRELFIHQTELVSPFLNFSCFILHSERSYVKAFTLEITYRNNFSTKSMPKKPDPPVKRMLHPAKD